MGYFSNGTEGESYYEHYCARCIHDDEEKGKYCPIWNLHLLHNYAECNNKDSYLHVLIPHATEDNSQGKGTGRHIAMFILRSQTIG